MKHGTTRTLAPRTRQQLDQENTAIAEKVRAGWVISYATNPPQLVPPSGRTKTKAIRLLAD